MNVLYWNIRGIGNDASQNMLRQHCFSSRPSWVSIAEPKVPFNSIASSYWNSLGLRLVGLHSASRLPNIWVLENASLAPSMMIFSSPQMVVIQVVSLQLTYLIAFIHADTDHIIRRTLWDDIFSLPAIPLLLVGDFNSVLGAHERSSGSPRPMEVQEFSAFINSGSFIEPACSGNYFTWSNKRFTNGYLETRIDRVLASVSFMDLWDSVSYHVGIRNCSDHSPLVLRCSTGHVLLPRPFRFQNMWLHHDTFEATVKASWSLQLNASGAFAAVMGKLKRLKARLRVWNVNVFGILHTRKLEAQARIESVQADLSSLGSSDLLHSRELAALSSYNDILDQEATFLRQKSRAAWLRDGDRNTSFFHRNLKCTRGQGGISSLVIDDSLTTDQQVISTHVVSYYENLFRQDPDFTPCFDGLEEFFPTKISPEQNQRLIQVPSHDDVKHAVFGMSPDSAPGPDGFGGRFYQDMWHIVGVDVTSAIRSFFFHGDFPSGINASFVTLIPKLRDATRIEDFRPIVLGNFLYKIVTKILADRLGSLLNNLLSFHQFGFIPGRRIHDCIALASEGVNGLGLPCRDGNMVLKIDIRKAFDTLNWAFLLEVLKSWGFSNIFIGWINFILKSARLSVLLNGAPVGYFSCSQGVRQGDPLSPLLFCLAEEVLSRLLTHASDSGKLSPLFLGRNVSFPSHLLYADDVIIFCRATSKNCRRIIKILNTYKDWSGQHFNPQKSKVYFSNSISSTIARRLSRCLGIGTGSLPFTYLGVPLFTGAPKTRHLQSIADGIIAKFALWKGNSLSMAGRICLVQSFIQGAFVHSMMIYRWPKTVLRKLEACMRNFVVTGDILRAGSVKVSWKRCCVPKEEGGLGLRSMVTANKAFLSRLSWDIINHRAPYMDIFLVRYLDKGRLRNYVHSSVWFGFKDNYPHLTRDSRWLISQDSKLRFWLDNWLGYCIADRIQIPEHLRHHYEFTISDYVLNGTWDLIPEFMTTFPEISRDILAYHLAPPSEDKRIWSHSTNGEASSAAFYHHLRPTFPTTIWGTWIWAAFIPPRRSLTVWRAIYDRLPTLDNLRVTGFTGPSICIFCMSTGEALDHILVSCPFIRTIWSRLFDMFNVHLPDFYSFNELLLYTLSQRFSPQVMALWRLTIITFIWVIWKARNQWIFEGKVSTQQSMIHLLLRLVYESRLSIPGTMYNTQEDLFTLHSFGITGRPRSGPLVTEVRWSPPAQGWFKCNTDGSAKGAPGEATAAGIFRDNNGAVLCCFVQHLGLLHAFEAELMAVLIGIEIADSQGWHRLWIETDSTYVEGLITTRSSVVPWKYRNRWLVAMKKLLHFDLKVTHIFREGNTVADSLSNHHVQGVWFHQLDCIDTQVARDLSGLPYFRIQQH